MTIDSIAEATCDIGPFPTIRELLDRHTALAERRRGQDGDSPGFWAEVQEFIARTRRTGRVLDGQEDRGREDRSAAQAVLNLWASQLYRARGVDVEALLESFDLGPSRELADADCPYPGLKPYGRDTEQYFIGRNGSTEAALGLLNQGGRFLAIVGLPGGGKTSLMQAGILPALRAGGVSGSEHWRYLPPVVPDPERSGVAVFERLVRTIRPDRAGDDVWVREQVDRVRNEPRRVTDLLRQRGDTPVVLVVDPFEDLFLLDTGPLGLEPDLAGQSGMLVSHRFAASLAALATEPGPRHTVIITLRRASAPKARALVPLKGLWGDADSVCVMLQPPSSDELRDMVLAPARLVGLRLEDAVVRALVNDIVGEPWALPLLQFALRRLWDARDRNRITWREYTEVFGAGGALGSVERAGESFYAPLSDVERATARAVLTHLVRPVDVPGAGRVVTLLCRSRAALAESIGSELPLAKVAEGLVTTGLLRNEVDDDGASRLTLAHEMVVDHWPRLKRWLDEAEQASRLRIARRRLRREKEQKELATARQIAGRADTTLRDDRALLLADEALSRAEQFRDKPDEASKVFPEARNALLRALTRSPRLDQYVFSNLGEPQPDDAGEFSVLEPASLVALSPDGRTLAVVTPTAPRESDAANRIEDSDTIRLWDYRPNDSSGAATAPGSPTRPRCEATLAGRVYSLAFSDDSSRLAAGVRIVALGDAKDRAGQVLIWDVTQPDRLSPLSRLHQGEAAADPGLPFPTPVAGVAFRPGHPDHLAIATKPIYHGTEPFGKRWCRGEIHLWDITNGRPLGPPGAGHFLPSGETPRVAMAFSPDGEWLATGGGIKAGGQEPEPSGECELGEIRLWNVDRFPADVRPSSPIEPREPLRLSASPPSGGVCALAFAPKWSTPLLAAGTVGGSVVLLDVHDSIPRPLGELPGSEGAVRALAFDRDPGPAIDRPASRLAVGSGQTVQLWDVSNPEMPRAVDEPLSGHLGAVQSLWFAPQGAALYSAALDQSVIRWKLGIRGHLARAANSVADKPRAVAFSRQGIVATACDDDGTVVLWDTSTAPTPGAVPSTLTQLATLRSKSAAPIVLKATCLAFSPDGRRLASGDVLGGVRFWINRARADQAPEFSEVGDAANPAHSAPVNGLAFEASGGRLASSGDDKQVILWSWPTEDERHPAVTRSIASPTRQARIWFPNEVAAAVFHPDGERLAVADWDRTIHIVDLRKVGAGADVRAENLQEVTRRVLRGHVGAVLALDFSPAGRLASGGMDGLVYLWDIDSGKHGSPLRGHSRPVWSVKFSPHPANAPVQWLISASQDEISNLILWNVPDPLEVIPLGSPLVGHSGGVVMADFRPTDTPPTAEDPAGRFELSTLGRDRMVLVWDISLDAWRKAARRISGRTPPRLDDREWKAMLPGIDPVR